MMYGDTEIKRQTICWYCKKAYGHCSWSNGTFTPVPGWDATYSPIKSSPTGFEDSYIVHACPLYEVG